MRTTLRLVTVVCVLFPAVAAAQPERIHRAQSVSASSLDPSLPDVSLDLWLRQTLGPSAQYDWTPGLCAGERDHDNPAVPLCGIVAATDSRGTVTVGVRLGDYVQDARVDRWGVPRLDAAFISRGRVVVMLDRLGALPRILNLPSQQWPRSNVVLESVRCSPEYPQPAQEVTCAIAVANNGDAPSLARVFLDVALDRNSSGDAAITLDVRARKTVRITFPWTRHHGEAITAGVAVDDRSPYHRVNERGELTLTPEEDLNVPADLLGWEDDDNAPRTIISARASVRGARVIDVPVDASITRLVVSIESIPGVSGTLLRPNGARVSETDRDVRFSDLKTMDLDREMPANLRVMTIARPQPGIWRVEVSGSGNVLVKAVGNSPIGFDDFDFVRLQEGVHGGYFEMDGLPLTGMPATGRARPDRGPDDATFRLIDETGATLRNVSLRKRLPDSSGDDYLGTFDPPAVPFRIVMNGLEESGAPVQRVHPVTFRAQPVAVFFTRPMLDVVAPGSSRRFSFAVTNVGNEAATFALKVTTTVGEIRDLSPAVVTVQPGTSATPSFSLAVPAHAERFFDVELRMTATSTADDAVSNSASARLDVARAGDADNDYVDDDLDNCPAVPNATQLDVNQDGIGDACDPTLGGPLTISGVSPESGPPGTIVRIIGSGFSTKEPAGVFFNGLVVPARSMDGTELQVAVPAGAAVGPIPLIVGTEGGFGMAPKPFIVRPAVVPAPR